MKRTKLIVFTGIDGSGKTTQSRLLIEHLISKGIKASYVWCRWEPFLLRPFIERWKKIGATASGDAGSKDDLIKSRKQKLLNNPLFRYLWLTSFLIEYALQILIRVRFRLLKNQLVVSDRIYYDSIIDQAVNLGRRKDKLLNRLDSVWMRIFFPKPDMVIYVDCPEDVAFSRKVDAPNIEYLRDRRRLYLDLAEKYRWIKIDGTHPIDELSFQITTLVQKKLYI